MPRIVKAKRKKSKAIKKKRTTKKRGNKYNSKFRVNLKSHKHKEINDMTFWMMIIVLLISNLIISIVLIPFLVILKTLHLFVLIIILGILFGSLFKIVLDSIGNLEKKHHYIATFFIPILAIINISLITTLTNELIQYLKITSSQNPLILGLIYALAFITPFIYKTIKEKIIK